MKKILIISDNDFLFNNIFEIIKNQNLNLKYNFEFAFSPINKLLGLKYKDSNLVTPLDINNIDAVLNSNFELILSLHCKQFFPAKIVNSVRCVNVHPGLNPYNRGWFPQVFSIINGLPSGVTIHEMDEELDNGNIIFQKEISLLQSDTSFTAYNKILELELSLLRDHLEQIILNNYASIPPSVKGNLNLKKDFDKLCQLDLNNMGSFKEHLNLLRALTHNEYSNAFFYDENGKKVFVKIEFSTQSID